MNDGNGGMNNGGVMNNGGMNMNMNGGNMNGGNMNMDNGMNNNNKESFICAKLLTQNGARIDALDSESRKMLEVVARGV